MTRTSSAAPRHSSRPSKAWFRTIVAAYELEATHLRLLQAACEAWDRAQEARERVTADGAVIADRFGHSDLIPRSPREGQRRIAFARLVRELNMPRALDGTIR